MSNRGMLRIHLSSLLQASGMSKNKFCQKAEIQHSQLKGYMDNTISRLDTDVMIRICHTLDCSIADLLEYQLFRNHSKPLQQLEILQWSFESGPQIVGSINNFDEKLKKAMEIGSTADICASAGYLLEYMCEKLSCILSTSIKRKYGDRYTIGDLWPGIYKELKKSLAKNEFSELNDLLYLRNMVGSHYNE